MAHVFSSALRLLPSNRPRPCRLLVLFAYVGFTRGAAYPCPFNLLRDFFVLGRIVQGHRRRIIIIMLIHTTIHHQARIESDAMNGDDELNFYKLVNVCGFAVL